MVDIRPLLPVNLDVDIQAIHQLGRCGILEGFVRHDMAPVASGVTDREQDRAAERVRLGQGRGTPRPPVHRVIGMLQQIGGCFELQQISRLHRDVLKRLFDSTIDKMRTDEFPPAR